MTSPSLYPAQKTLVSRLLARPSPLAATVVGGTGCGKTGISIQTSVELKARRILVVCPAIVRYHWAAEFAKWADRVDVGIIEMGRSRKSGTKKALLARDWAYMQNVVVVSYDLVKEFSNTHWDLVIIDECHNLGDPLSKQSKLAGLLRKDNPSAHWLCLSATPIPTNAKQVWYPQYLLHGASVWGKPAPNGGVSWKFATCFLDITRNEYGTAIGGLREDRRDDLRKLMAARAEFISRTDIASDLPPLDVSPLYTSKVDAEFYTNWLESLPEDITHACVLTYHIAEAQMVKSLVRDRPVFYIDGTVPTGERHRILEAAAASERCVLVGTQEALSEGIRLMWVQKCLITEFRRSPGQVTQLLGRFQSVGSPLRPMVEIAFDDNSDGLAELLLERTKDINDILRAGAVPEIVAQVFQPRALDECRLTTLFGNMLGSFNEAKTGWEDDDDDLSL
jgi:hypothetical protein